MGLTGGIRQQALCAAPSSWSFRLHHHRWQPTQDRPQAFALGGHVTTVEIETGYTCTEIRLAGYCYALSHTFCAKLAMICPAPAQQALRAKIQSRPVLPARTSNVSACQAAQAEANNNVTWYCAFAFSYFSTKSPRHCLSCLTSPVYLQPNAINTALEGTAAVLRT